MGTQAHRSEKRSREGGGLDGHRDALGRSLAWSLRVQGAKAAPGKHQTGVRLPV